MTANQQQNSTKREELVKGLRVSLTFNNKQLALIDTLVGEIGDDRADVVKTIFFSWLSEKEVTPALIKKRLRLS